MHPGFGSEKKQREPSEDFRFVGRDHQGAVANTLHIPFSSGQLNCLVPFFPQCRQMLLFFFLAFNYFPFLNAREKYQLCVPFGLFK